MAITMTQALGTGFGIKMYGEAIDGMEASGLPVSFSDHQHANKAGSPPGLRFAQIRAFRLGDFCTTLPRATIMVVLGDGEPLSADDGCGRQGETAWTVLPSDRSMALVPLSGDVMELLDELQTKGIDGNIEFSNPRIQDGKACVDIRVWCKVEIWGARWSFDERFPVCIPLEGCHTIWDIGVASVEVCFRAPNQLCAKLCVGKWGLSKCWDACVSVPLSATSQPAGSAPCGCH